MRVLVNVMLRPLLECFNDLSYSSKDRQHPQLGLCVSCVMGFIELMTPDHYRKLRATFDVKEDLEVRERGGRERGRGKGEGRREREGGREKNKVKSICTMTILIQCTQCS